jgi:hypothetical protein
MKNHLLPRFLFVAIVLFSLFSFAYVNLHAIRKQQCSATSVPMVQTELTRQEDQPDEDSGESRLPDVAALGFLLKLAGKLLPVAN